MCFFWRKKKKALKEENVVSKQQVEPVQEAPVTLPQEEIKKEQPKEQQELKSEPVISKAEPAKKPVITEKEEPKATTDEDLDGEEKEELNAKTTAPKIAKYHVSQNKDEKSDNFKKWRVRKEGSTKTIKFFDTQKEAIEFAEGLAESAGSSVVIHKVDGSIRKQDYTKK